MSLFVVDPLHMGSQNFIDMVASPKCVCILSKSGPQGSFLKCEVESGSFFTQVLNTILMFMQVGEDKFW